MASRDHAMVTHALASRRGRRAALRAPAAPDAGLPGGRGARPRVRQILRGPGGQAVVRRKPGENARESWDALVGEVVDPATRGKKMAAREAVRRFLTIARGQQLINDLWKIFCGRRKKCRSGITAHFVDTLPPSATEATGYFQPDQPDEPHYDVYVRNQDPPSAGTLPGGLWPGGTSMDIAYSFSDPESDMASTLFHETLHVWFLHAHRQTRYFGSGKAIVAAPDTGHGDVLKGDIDPDFHDALKGSFRQLDELESTLKAEKRKQEAEKAAVPPPAAEPEPEPAPERKPSPSLLGIRAELGVGGAGGDVRASAVGILGADLVLGRISALNIGARGVYLTPDRLLAGGAVGYRWVGDKDAFGRRHDRPLFFDLEAGVLAELGPAAAERITKNVAVMASAGIGQELGTEGPRLFWKVGGFVIVTDKDTAEGHPHVVGGGGVGLGVRY